MVQSPEVQDYDFYGYLLELENSDVKLFLKDKDLTLLGIIYDH
jgi:hypothetical protein